LNKHNGASSRQDLEVALANLARQPSSPETLAAMRELDQRLSEMDRNEKDLPAQLSQNQQEAADAAAELAKLQALQKAYEKEAKAFTADALSARQNRLRLASKLEYFIVRAQAEDLLEQGRRALETVEHLSPSPEVENLLRGPGSTAKSDTDLEQMRNCIQESGDVKACRQAPHQE
jgi:chromosome segregation ATPase